MTPTRLDGAVAIVTGGTGGLGRAVTLAFLEAGANVTVTYRDPAERDALAARLPPPASVSRRRSPT
jgi:3-oxoacyl-[acyl-carrier protein] reductase